MKLNIEQGSPEWHKLRREKIGASDAPVIMNSPGAYKTRLQLWEEKVWDKKQGENFAMSQGREWEPRLRDWASKKLGMEFKPEVHVHNHLAWMMASYDGVYRQNLLEIKRVDEEKHEMAKAGKIPPVYFYQLQHQMEVFDVDFMFYLSSHKDDIVLIETKADDLAIREMLDAEQNFHCLMKGNEPPEACERDKVAKDGDPNWVKHWNRAKAYKAERDRLDSLYETEKEILIGMADGKSVDDSLGKLTRYIKKGGVDYKAIPELRGVNLESYRKDPSVEYKISFAKELIEP